MDRKPSGKKEKRIVEKMTRSDLKKQAKKEIKEALEHTENLPDDWFGDEEV